MLTRNELKQQLEETNEDLLRTISSFTNEQFNKVPFEDSWTAGQVVEHVYKSQSGLPGLISGNTRPTERAVDEHASLIASIFLDFTTKMKSPDFILPGDDEKDTETFIKKFKTLGNDIDGLVESTDLTRTLTDFSFPQVGDLTAYEWLYFTYCHTTRHLRQLRNIRAALQQ